ncbi:LOW QUALITY PROTEIN: L-seryl-tRNA(Sec) kinase [Clupea harengus]|uniref:LOW QUALITY PROTEIN: L-seryl-tRNA(Sec) kinase n=1 Tax=Clupea harengus TaxID=7950 RepID=A0A6P3W3U6_CLUHA|nr:LOW QUALITY PROTEIN: L-seryl-tRNA(Sec) kinase [Clupea harengus]
MHAERDEAPPCRRICLCLLCGLPAAGKTTLVQALSNHTALRGWKTLSLIYDELIPQEAFSKVYMESDSQPLQTQTKWKNSRQAILSWLAQFLQNPSQDPSSCRSDPEVWSQLCMTFQKQHLPTTLRSSPSHAQTKLLFLLDDNFYYQSMRYEVYQLARKYAVGFCQVYLQCPTELCVSRNRSRTVPLSEEVILDMVKRMEPPNPLKNSWEQNSLTLNSCKELTNQDLQSLTTLIASAFDNPLSPFQDDTEKRDMDRQSCANSVVHQADQACRRLVSQAMLTAREKSISPETLQSLAKELNKSKTRLLQDLRKDLHRGFAISPDESMDIERAVGHTVVRFDGELKEIIQQPCNQ